MNIRVNAFNYLLHIIDCILNEPRLSLNNLWIVKDIPDHAKFRHMEHLSKRSARWLFPFVRNISPLLHYIEIPAGVPSDNATPSHLR